MPGSDKDDLADALSRLAGGEQVDESHDAIPSEPVHLTDPPKSRSEPVPAARKQGPAPQQKPTAQPRPTTPVPAKPSLRPTVPGAPVPKIRPSAAPAPRLRPQSPSAAPGAQKSTDPPAQSRTAAPVDATPAAHDDVAVSSQMLSSALENVVDSDEVDMPAPEARVFAGKTLPPRPKRLPLYARLGFRRTLIPILITMGLCLPTLGIWWFALDADNPFRNPDLPFPPLALPVALLGVGAVMLALAVMNMLQVRKQLAAAN